MAKIKQILEYNFSDFEIACLLESQMINGCGGKGGIDFWDIVQELMENLKWFDIKHFAKLWTDFTMICHEHDLDFRLQRGFFKSNFKMGLKVYKLVSWWAWKKEAFILATTIFSLLQKYWKQYYENANPLNSKK